MRKVTLTTVKNSLLNGLSSIGEGLYSIGEGMVSLFGYNPRIKILSDEEAYKKDCENLRRDWEVVGKDLEKAMNSKR